MSKKKEVSKYDDLRKKTVILIESKVGSKEIAKGIEKGIESIAKIGIDDLDLMLYTTHIVKVLENLKNQYVLKNLKNNNWKPEDLASMDKDAFEPEKWQKIHEDRLPKNIEKEKRKSTTKCPKCKSWYTEYTTAQTRSADEPSTLFFLCTDCEHRWRM